MTKKYKILGKYIRDMSSETPDTETYIFVRDHISKYQLNIDINSKALKNKMVEVNTLLKFEDIAISLSSWEHDMLLSLGPTTETTWGVAQAFKNKAKKEKVIIFLIFDN